MIVLHAWKTIITYKIPQLFQGQAKGILYYIFLDGLSVIIHSCIINSYKFNAIYIYVYYSYSYSIIFMPSIFCCINWNWVSQSTLYIWRCWPFIGTDFIIPISWNISWFLFFVFTYGPINCPLRKCYPKRGTTEETRMSGNWITTSWNTTGRPLKSVCVLLCVWLCVGVRPFERVHICFCACACKEACLCLWISERIWRGWCYINDKMTKLHFCLTCTKTKGRGNLRFVVTFHSLIVLELCANRLQPEVMLPKLTGIDGMTFQLAQLLKTSPWDTEKHRERDSRASMMHFSLMFYLQNNTKVDKHTEGRVLWEMFSLTHRTQVCVTDVWLKVCEVSPPVLNLSQIFP